MGMDEGTIIRVLPDLFPDDQLSGRMRTGMDTATTSLSVHTNLMIVEPKQNPPSNLGSDVRTLTGMVMVTASMHVPSIQRSNSGKEGIAPSRKRKGMTLRSQMGACLARVRFRRSSEGGSSSS